LNNGVEIPWLGLGVYQAEPGDETKTAVQYALQQGYRHVDTAAIYGNEADVGAGIRESGVPRSEIFVTTKLWNHDQGYDSTLKAFDNSMKKLGLETLDLYLMHWPVVEKRKESWRAMESILESGRCRAIGVSNFMEHHIQEFLDAGVTVPAVNQVEFSPFLFKKKLLELCQKSRIQLEAYSPLTKGERLAHPALAKIGAKHGRSPAQVLIRWCLEHDVVVIPKSTNPKRIVENASVFDFALDDKDMAVLNELDEDLHTGWDPTNAP
jgi:diketogulonate reductase-like aldo/keto reductase